MMRRSVFSLWELGSDGRLDCLVIGPHVPQ